MKSDVTADRRKLYGDVSVELENAVERFYPTPERAMKWILEFSQRDLSASALDSQSWMTLAFEIESFVWHGPPGQERVNLANTKGWSVPVLAQVTIPSRKEALALQDCLRTSLNRLLTEGRTSIRIPEMTIHIRRLSRTGEIDRFLAADKIQDVFVFYFTRLLIAHAHRVLRCDDCPNLYLAMRRKQKYCTRKCQSRVSTRLSRQRDRRGRRLAKHSKKSKRGIRTTRPKEKR